MTRTKSMYLALLTVLLSPMAANADPIVFDFVGTCVVDCARFGLSDGDAFDESGVLVLADGTSTAAGTSFTFADIDFFSFFGIDFLASTNLIFDTVGFTSDGVLGGFRLLGGTNAFCYNDAGTTCAGGGFDTIVGALGSTGGHGPAEFVLARQVPEPGTLALLGIGLFGMGLARRRKAV